MHRTYIKDLKEHIGSQVLIQGWVDARRDHGKILFIDLRDVSGKVQCVDARGLLKDVRPEWVLSLTGLVKKRPEKMVNPGVPNGDLEFEIEKIDVLGAARDLPFDLTAEVNLDTYLDYLPYTLRTPRAREIFSVQADIIESFRESLRSQGFTEFQAPALVGGDAEGGAAAFTVDYYYGQKAFLATSPQFYKQILVGSCERAFATPKVFRGEKHATTRHLSEYTSMDFEMGFIRDHRDVMEVLAGVMRAIVARVGERISERPLLPATIPTLKLREAQEILGVPPEPDLDPEHEREICEWAKEKHKSDFVFVTHYPVSKRPFYTYEDESDPGFTKSFDLLFRGLEITTGGQRIHDYDALVGKLRERGLDPEKFSYYLQAFKYGMPPHGGSATGLERLTARMLNIQNIKEATLFPRDLNRIDVLLSSNKPV